MLKGKDLQCDGCWSHEYLDVTGFANKVDKIKNLGWKIKKVLNEWCHYCPDCIQERKDIHANNYWWND